MLEQIRDIDIRGNGTGIAQCLFRERVEVDLPSIDLYQDVDLRAALQRLGLQDGINMAFYNP